MQQHELISGVYQILLLNCRSCTLPF